MGVRRRHLWPWAGLLLLVAVMAVVYIVHTHDPQLASTLVSALAVLVAIACAPVRWPWAWRRPLRISRLQLGRAADELADQVYREWERAAGERRLVYPAPMCLRWQWSRRQVTGPVTEAVGGAGRTRFDPVPGMVTITAERLQSGTLQDLLDVYGGLDSGRLVIVGGPGAGKTSAAIQLLLDALRHRAASETVGERARIPVPVLVTLHGWDPTRERFADWLANKLTRDHELLTAREYGPNTAARLIDGGYLAAILDGLDEIPEMLRPVVLKALDVQATFRLVVLTRSKELVAAVSDAHLPGAAAVELCPVEPRQAAEYLASCQTDSLSPAWQRVVEDLHDRPGSILAQALDTPLMVALIRDTYRRGDPVDELIDSSSRFTSRDAIEDHLLDRVLPIAYARHPGRPAPPCTADEARQWLGSLARHMNDAGTRDLAWWQIPRWVPAWPRTLATALVVGLGAMLVFGLVGGFVVGLVGGFAVGLENGLKYGLVYGSAAGSVYALAVGIVSMLGGGCSRQPGWLPFNRTDIRTILTLGLLVGLVFLPTNWSVFVFVFRLGFVVGLVIVFVYLLMNVLVFGIAFGLLTKPAEPSAEAASSSIDPRSLWRRERRLGLKTGLVYGLTAGLMCGLTNGLIYWFLFTGELTASLVVVVAGGLAITLAFGLGAMLASSTTWAATLANTQLWHRGESSARLLNFLEDAHAREVLRSVGPVYQFRHARLQDRLAGGSRVLRRTWTGRPTPCRRRAAPASHTPADLGHHDCKPAASSARN